jgi:hypothetical protein
VKHDARSEKARAAIATGIVAAAAERKARTSAAVRKAAAIRPEVRIVRLKAIAGRRGQVPRKEHRAVQRPREPRAQVKQERRRRSDQSVPNDKSGKSVAIDQSEPTVASAPNVLTDRHGQKAPKTSKQKAEAADGADVASVVLTVQAAMVHKILGGMRRATVPPSPRGRGRSNLVRATTSSRANRR